MTLSGDLNFRKTQLKIAKMLHVIFTEKDDFLENMERYLKILPMVLPDKQYKMNYYCLLEKTFMFLLTISQHLKRGQLSVMRKKIRKFSDEIVLDEEFGIFIIIWLSMREWVMEHSQQWISQPSRTLTLAACDRFWFYLFNEALNAYSCYTEQVLQDKKIESTVLFHTSQSVTAELNLESLLAKIIFHAGMLIPNRKILLFLPETKKKSRMENERLILYSPKNQQPNNYSVNIGDGPIGKAAKLLIPVLLNNCSEIKSFLPIMNPLIKQILAVPIAFSEELLGVIVAVGFQPKDSFNQSAKELLLMYSQQIAISLKNVFLYQTQTTVTHELEEKNTMLENQAELVLKKSAQMEVLNEVARRINSSLEWAEVLFLVARYAAESIGVNQGIIWLFNDKKTRLEAITAFGLSKELLGKLNFDLVDIKNTPVFQVLEEQKTMTVSLKQHYDFCWKTLNGQLTGSTILLVPLILKDEIIGLLCVEDTREMHDFLEDEISLVTAIANQTVIAIENARLYQKVKEQAITDGLTGIYNHRYFQLRLSEEYANAKRYGNDLSVILFDIDHFKLYNDTYGHIAGDLALKEIASLASASIRTNDIIARYGGEEFVIILPMTNQEGAHVVAERIRCAVMDCRFLGDLNVPQVSITISLGVATFQPELENREMLVKQADTALYAAKHSGRNQTLFYTSALLK